MKDIDTLRRLARKLKENFKLIIEGDEHKFTYQVDGKKQVIALHMNYFELKNIPKEIYDLKSLKCLDISFNEINYIPERLLELVNLEEFWIKGNEIQEIPEFLLSLKKLKEIYCSENPLIRPPLKGYGNGLHEIKDFYDQLNNKKIYKIINEAKVVVLGEGDVGKTCLIERLINNSFEKQQRTKGISIKQWKTTLNKDNLNLNFWDFGGQEIYHSTHQFFLTKRSLYILVWNARKSKDYEHIYKWLNIIDAYSKNSPILIVMTKKNEMNDNLNMIDITKRFSQVKDLIKVDSKTGEGFTELTSAIRKYSWDLPVMRTPWIKSWFQIKDSIEKSDRNWISSGEFKEICNKKGISGDNFIKIDEYMHDIGHIIHFSKDLNLSPLVILKPEWATKAVYSVLDHNAILENKGILENSWLDQIWVDNVYPLEVHDRLLQLMNKFELSYELLGKGSHLIAELLPLVLPNFHWNYDVGLKLFYSYDFLPSGILTRFIVLVHNYIVKDKDKYPVCWKEGVLIEDVKSKALVILNTPERRIEINVQGENSRDLLSVITHYLDGINKRINNVKYTKLIPCNCINSCDKLWPYNNLKKLEQKGINDIRCDESGNIIEINRLLNYYELDENRLGKPLENNRNSEPVKVVVTQINNQEVSLKIDFDINVSLPEMQTSLYELEDELVKIDKNYAKNQGVSALVESFDKLGPSMKDDRFYAPFNKLRRFIEKAQKKDSDLNKILTKTKEGIVIVRKICGIYNKFAQWLILPQVPDIFTL